MSAIPSNPERSILGPAVDTYMAAVPWTKNRTAIVYLREHAGRAYVRIRTFNRHQVKGCWYPTKRFYMIPLDQAEVLGKAIMAAADRRRHGTMPEWYADFEKQYSAQSWRSKDDVDQLDAGVCSNGDEEVQDAFPSEGANPHLPCFPMAAAPTD